MTGLASQSDWKAEVWMQLATVVDPELDESIVDLGFVKGVELHEGDVVHIAFRLPTYWCAANFSFLMADDIRKAVGGLPWVRSVVVTLDEHMYGDQINAGLAKGLSFQETFGAEADGDLEELRRTFLVKAFQRRQMALLSHMTSVGYSTDRLVGLSLAELRALPLDESGKALVARYLERRDVVGRAHSGALAFVTSEGRALKAETYFGYLSGLRTVGLNAEFNSMICRGLLAGRDREVEAGRMKQAAGHGAATTCGTCGGGCGVRADASSAKNAHAGQVG
ncbi:iron-sulfur cluster assembly protein [Bradyrhizobium sp. CER78]|uniref:metal-sulfur cluster assembly factor n=1 Tax=Bradyrhizobium sp. CER78 TaxID=3039162 RepID=UPI00244C7E27|nr:iron-sulfur cluster assembly protein [Bradyrhizobium sp. CER78]MDH2380837.1 iron-sulfur cluster assembly protein [Bradyrhizobium sp. CER78]